MSALVFIPTAIFDDPSLSCEAFGLYAKLASKPADWEYCTDELAAYCEGLDAFVAAEAELIAGGWLDKQTRHPDGKTRFRLHTVPCKVGGER